MYPYQSGYAAVPEDLESQLEKGESRNDTPNDGKGFEQYAPPHYPPPHLCQRPFLPLFNPPHAVHFYPSPYVFEGYMNTYHSPPSPRRSKILSVLLTLATIGGIFLAGFNYGRYYESEIFDDDFYGDDDYNDHGIKYYDHPQFREIEEIDHPPHGHPYYPLEPDHDHRPPGRPSAFYWVIPSEEHHGEEDPSDGGESPDHEDDSEYDQEQDDTFDLRQISKGLV